MIPRFKEYLNEAKKTGLAWQTKNTELIFKEVIHVPLLSVIRNIFKKTPITTFRLLNATSLDSLVKEQNSDHSVATFTRLNHDHNLSFGVISSNTGIIVKLKGSPLLINPNDAMTIPDQRGVRWVSVENRKIIDRIKKIQIDLIKKYFGKYMTIHVIDVNSLDKKVEAELVKEYYTRIKKLINTMKKDFFIELYPYMNKADQKVKTYDDWDEIVLTKYTIQNIYLINTIIPNKIGVEVQEKYYKKLPVKWIQPEEVHKVVLSQKNKI